MSDPTDEAPPPSVEVSDEIAEPAETTTNTVAGDPLAPPAEVFTGALPYPSPPSHEPPTQVQPPPAASEEPTLPATADLNEAVGAPTRRRDTDLDDDGPTPPRSRRTQAIAALALVGGLAIAGLVFLGRANSDRYLLACSTDRVTPEQGRSFPPWGSRPLTGPEWKPLTLPPNAECTPRETDNPAELERLYLDLVVDRASTTLTSKTLLDRPAGSGAVAPLDSVTDQLTQALLLARSPDRRDQRKEIERLMGDVTYWRASLRLRDASVALVDAAKQFELAAGQRPRHVTDAETWATFLRRIVDELHAGPGGAPPIAAPPAATEPRAPMGSAMPVEPPPSEGSPAAAPLDAGLPTGGVLL